MAINARGVKGKVKWARVKESKRKEKKLKRESMRDRILFIFYISFHVRAYKSKF